jgi:hypothetical protein
VLDVQESDAREASVKLEPIDVINWRLCQVDVVPSGTTHYRLKAAELLSKASATKGVLFVPFLYPLELNGVQVVLSAPSKSTLFSAMPNVPGAVSLNAGAAAAVFSEVTRSVACLTFRSQAI